jgi:cell fate regulator YaaT (PSP1 superfamily)
MSEAAVSTATSRRIVGVQFRRAAAMIYDFDAADLPLRHDTCVIVETERGEALGWTVGEPEDREPVTDGALRRVLRVVGPEDKARHDSWQTRELEALRFCAERARQLNLAMKVIAVEWAHSGEKAAFYFSSEDRIDFRELVRELAQRFRVRVEMRQVGPRDEAKIIGALGPCGRETCCSSWMRAFAPVSIKMAKDQGLSINPAKVTGVCGRLLCCLAYEQDTYRDLRRKLPRFGKQVMTPRGPGRVVDVLVLREHVRVQLDGEDQWIDFAAADVRPLGAAPVDEPETEAEGDQSDVVPEVPEALPGRSGSARPAGGKPPASAMPPGSADVPSALGPAGVPPAVTETRKRTDPRELPPRDQRRQGRPAQDREPRPSVDRRSAQGRPEPRSDDKQSQGRIALHRRQGQKPESATAGGTPAGARAEGPSRGSGVALPGAPQSTPEAGEHHRRPRHRHRHRRGGGPEGGGGPDSGGSGGPPPPQSV